MKMKWSSLWCIAGIIILNCAVAQAVYTSAKAYLDRPAEWFKSDEAAKIASNILSFQASNGGFPKNVDTASRPYTGDTATIHATFDNSATTDELRYLAHIYNATQNPRYQQAFLKGLDYVLAAQYPNGGWPQSYPPGETDYDQYITFNDGAMARLMFFIREVANDPTYNFVDAERRDHCRTAWDRGIDCILKCQVRVNGKLTAWPQQSDEKDFTPRPARKFEPIALTPNESVGICHVLMNVDHPSPAVIQAVDAAVAWMDAVKIPGIRVEDRPQKDTPRGFERFVVKDPSAPPMWARYYEIGTNRPIYCGRDSVVRYDLSEIEIERRTGYQWLKYWPKNLIATEYPAWKAKVEGAAASTQPSK
ncbi:MAG TPA: pectate lyase [Tepidisphaeraceae bacterium]|nr:pectate lyase [Tepidisphaeraceae bacterium]